MIGIQEIRNAEYSFRRRCEPHGGFMDADAIQTVFDELGIDFDEVTNLAKQLTVQAGAEVAYTDFPGMLFLTGLCYGVMVGRGQATGE